MCAIAGIFRLADSGTPIPETYLQAMLEAQAHRGPDDSGIWVGAGIGLAHRRLAVIDPQGSAQPMRSVDGQITVSFNGEIYNFKELRATLARYGHVFKTQGDTEVLIHAYRHWGVEMLAQLDGIFAFALFDSSQNKLLLARDRLGVKPLHYALLADGSICFASELKGVLAHASLRPELNVRAVDDFFALGYVPDDSCMISGVEKLPAGHMLVIKANRDLPRPRCWWNLDFSSRSSRSPARLEEELRDLLRSAVASRMVSDVPIGAFLSGGVDSASIVALMSEQSTAAVKSFTIGFGGAAEDETRFAVRVAKQFQTEAFHRTVDADDLASLDRLAMVFDEPFADASALPMLRLAELAREKVTVALSGDGADEAFAGYRRYQFQVAEDYLRQLFPPMLRRAVFGGLGAIFPKADWAPIQFRGKRSLQALGLSEAEAYARSVGYLVPEERAQLFTPDLMRSLQGYRAEERYEAVMASAPARSALDRAQYADFKIWLPGDILTKLDRTSMAVGLEVREPMLDHRLVEFAARLPTRLRLHHGQGKRILKRVMAGHLPEEILKRPKQGFSPPLASWFRSRLADRVIELTKTSALVQTGWFNMDRILAVVRAHQSGRADHSRLLWQVLIFDAVLRQRLNPGNALQ